MRRNIYILSQSLFQLFSLTCDKKEPSAPEDEKSTPQSVINFPSALDPSRLIEEDGNFVVWKLGWY